MDGTKGILWAKKRVGIGVRLAIMMAVLLLLSTGSFAVFSLLTQRREALDMFVYSSLNMTRSLERILRFSMLENRREEIGSAIKQIAGQDDIESVKVITHMGETVYSSRTGADRQVSMEDSACSGCHSSSESEPLDRLPSVADVRLLRDRKLAEISLPFYNSPDCYTAACHVHSPTETVLGVMQMGVSYAGIDEILGRSYIRVMAFSTVIAAVASLIVLGLIRRWVTLPVKELLRGTRLVAEGDLGHIIPVGEAEMGALASGFNKMQEKILSSQRQLIMVEKLASIGKLSASIAHEINNPLTGILTFAEDLMETSPPDDPRVPDYEVIRREAIRCREIVRELLDFSRQDKPDLRPTDMNEVLSHMVKFISKQAVFRNVELMADLQDNLPPVIADPIQIEQVVLGILVNASEAMPEGGKIFITSTSRADTEEVEVYIRDTGTGIPDENLHRIFEPFFSTKGGGSMGIGLAVSWNIINQHGGRLEVDSRPGEGTTFRIAIPWTGHAAIKAGTTPDLEG